MNRGAPHFSWATTLGFRNVEAVKMSTARASLCGRRYDTLYDWTHMYECLLGIGAALQNPISQKRLFWFK